MKQEIRQHPTKQIRVNELIPYENNPFVHNQDDIDQTADSIEQFGLAAMIGVDKENKIVFGHKRYYALMKRFNDQQMINVIDLGKLDDKSVGKYRVIDNMQVGKNVNSPKMLEELEKVYASIDDMAGEIDHLMNIDVDSLMSEVADMEAEKYQAEEDEEEKTRSASAGTTQIILAFPKEEAKLLEAKFRRIIEQTGALSKSDLIVQLVNEKYDELYPESFDKDPFFGDKGGDHE